MKIRTLPKIDIFEMDEPQREILIDAEKDDAIATVVIVKVPPFHKFPMHIHPFSEDCFFILSGGGEVFSPTQKYLVSDMTGVWISPGVPHGLSANYLGCLKLVFNRLLDLL